MIENIRLSVKFDHVSPDVTDKQIFDQVVF